MVRCLPSGGASTRADYQDAERAGGYHAFGQSADGREKHDLIGRAVVARVASDRDLDVLEVGTGTGWLAGRLLPHARRVRAVDGSSALLSEGRKAFPDVEFGEADLEQPLPFGDAEFDLAVACLVMHDLRSLARGFSDLRRVLRPGGRLIVVDLNAYYAHPVGTWKRTRLERWTRADRKLRLRPYGDWVRREDRTFAWGEGHASCFRTLPDLVNTAAGAGLGLAYVEDLIPPTDSLGGGLGYRMFRFPIFLLLEFRRPEEGS